jgi:predicted nuclease of predicted toxin-antitoxin system
MISVIVADESVDFAVIYKLRQDGYAVLSISERHAGWPDDLVLEFAFTEQGYLITEDKDFGELTYRLNKPSHGVLLIRLPEADSEQKAILVSAVMRQHSKELWQSFAVLNAQKLRIKPILQ